LGFGLCRILGLAYSCRRGDGNPVLSWLLAWIASRHSAPTKTVAGLARRTATSVSTWTAFASGRHSVAGSTYSGQAGHSPPRSEPHDWQHAHHAGWDAGVAAPFRL